MIAAFPLCYRLCSAVTLFHADCRDALRELPDDSLDSCVTDPPYALVSIVKRFGGKNAAPAKGNDAYMQASAGFMGKTWDTGEVAFSREFWWEVLRVLKPGAHIVAFGGTRSYHRMACAIEDSGFEIRDSLCWLYATGFPKSLDVSKGIDKALGAERAPGVQYVDPDGKPRGVDLGIFRGGSFAAGNSNYIAEKLVTAPATDAAREWEGWGTALKPAFEPIVLARKPLSEGTVAANVLKWRTGALNIDGCRIESGPDHAAKCASVVGLDSNRTGGVYGEWLGTRTDSFSPKGRWPANVVHDGSDEVVGMFPNSKSSIGNKGTDLGIQGGKFAAGNKGERLDKISGFCDSGSAARFFFNAKASKADRNGSRHPTVKPVKLMQWLARLITPPGGTILDPFAGSGTTGAAAALEGFKVILCEREDEYVGDIKRRFDTH